MHLRGNEGVRGAEGEWGRQSGATCNFQFIWHAFTHTHTNSHELETDCAHASRLSPSHLPTHTHIDTQSLRKGRGAVKEKERGRVPAPIEIMRQRTSQRSE